MSQPEMTSGLSEVIDVRGSGAHGEIAECTPVHHGEAVEVLRMTLPQGKEIPLHQSPGERVLICLSGRVHVQVEDDGRDLAAGQMLCVPAHLAHGISAHEDSLLVAMNVEACRERGLADGVDEASDESFPASDPPSQTPVTGEKSKSKPRR